MKGIKGKVALVTGSAAGIGRATAIAFSNEGAKVVVSDVNIQGGEETVNIIKKNKGEAFFIKCDVSKTSEVKQMVNICVERYGKLDFAFNNAGIVTGIDKTHELTEENFDKLINVNLKGVWLCMKYEIIQMLKQNKNGYSIVNMGSIAAMRGVGSIGLPVYGATKAGVVQLTRIAALEHAQTGIRINAVCPGLINTSMASRQNEVDPEAMARIAAGLPIGRSGEPEEIAGAVVWLCSDDASFVIGHALSLDGGAGA